MPGAKAQANLASMVMSAWYVTDKEACWWLSHRANARIAEEQVRRCRVSIRTGVRSVVAEAGHISLKTRPPYGEGGDAFR